MLKQLVHNGVMVPKPPSPLGLELRIRGEFVRLSPKQEEMAIAWAKKHGTPYVEDPVFIHNFLADFSGALGVEPPLTLDEVDFSPALAVVLRERAAREALTKEERKELAAQRKAERERLKEQYGHAIVNGERVEIGGYVVEPSGIFMGRGEHPLRGRWKEGATEHDITLNLSPDAPVPPGDWGEIVWQPDSLWVARWQDKLSGKLKYIWLSDTAPVKQKREAEKFDKAIELDAVLEEVRAKIKKNLRSTQPRRKMVATACYLIDRLCLRVGDEKDEDEADTVGATTLRPEHITLHDDGKTAEFRFLGKDSVEWHKTIDLPPVVYRNLQELIENARPTNGNDDKPQIFPLITSRSVNRFLSSVMPGLTAKVFRTHHATEVVQQVLEKADVSPDAPEYVKWETVTRANLAAAELCNHTKQAPANWPERKQRMQAREKRYVERVARYEAQLQERIAELEALLKARDDQVADCPVEAERKRIQAIFATKIARAERRTVTTQEKLDKARVALTKDQDRLAQRAAQLEQRTAALEALQERGSEPQIARAKKQLDTAREQLAKAEAAVQKRRARVAALETQLRDRITAREKLVQERDARLDEQTVEKWRERVYASFEKKIARAEQRIETARARVDKARASLGKLRAQISVNSEKAVWNLGTSLKSYIDPRVLYQWGRQVDYDVLERYYPTTLRRKFAWVRNQDSESEASD